MYKVSIEGGSMGELITNMDALLTAMKQSGKNETVTDPVPVAAQQTPTTSQAAPISTAVPTQTPSYTLDQLERAGVALLDAGRGGELISLLNSQFGISNTQQLPQERYGEFATAIRGLGAKI